MTGMHGGERFSELVRSWHPQLEGRLDEVTTERARHVVEDPSSTAQDMRRVRDEYLAERARRREAQTVLDRDLLALMETSKQDGRRIR